MTSNLVIETSYWEEPYKEVDELACKQEELELVFVAIYQAATISQDLWQTFYN